MNTGMCREKVRKKLPNSIGNLIAYILHPQKYYGIWKRDRFEADALKYAHERYERALAQMVSKDKIRCVFIVLNKSIWKYEYLFRLMEKHSRFDPVILICPATDWGLTAKQMKECYEYFVSSGHRTLCAYDDVKDSYLDIRKDLNPDILLYCSPYSWQIHPYYRIENFIDVLTVYVPYGMANTRYNTYNTFTDNIVWRKYTERQDTLEWYKSVMRNQGCNCVVTGFPGIDAFLDNTYSVSDTVWKSNNPSLKKIIWAPHHTIWDENDVIHYSCFLRYADYMLELAKKYENSVQFIFKPHPLLRPKLERLWGRKKSDDYFRQWISMPNTTYSEEHYVDMFLTSDAMIHDSGSFLIEYLYTRKPVMRTMNGERMADTYTDFAMECLDVYYKAYSEEDIEQFIINVIDGNDPMRKQRESFVHQKLLPPNGKLASQNILDDIIDSIDKQRV